MKPVTDKTRERVLEASNKRSGGGPGALAQLLAQGDMLEVASKEEYFSKESTMRNTNGWLRKNGYSPHTYWDEEKGKGYLWADPPPSDD